MVRALLRFRPERQDRQLDGLRRYGRPVHCTRNGRAQPPDQGRHFGLVVDDKEDVRAALREAGLDVQEEGSLDFLDPWGNHVQVVDYRDIQFTKAPHVLRAMAIEGLSKTEAAREELRGKGISD